MDMLPRGSLVAVLFLSLSLPAFGTEAPWVRPNAPIVDNTLPAGRPKVSKVP